MTSATPLPPYARLKGVTDVTQQLLTDSIDENLVAFFDWGIVNAGGFVNVPVLSPGVNDQYADEVLHPVEAEGVPSGTIWEAVHGNWVYETGVEAQVPPLQASGVFVNGVFYPTGTTVGQYHHYINYPEGRVVFDTPILTTSIVQVEHSYRWVNFYDQDVPWFRDVVFDAFLIDDQPTGAGFTELLKDNRVWLPAVIVEPVMTRRQRGIMLGSSAQWIDQDVLFHIIAERADQRNNIMDIISLEKDRSFYLFDVNARRRANDFALDWRGSPTHSGRMYPELVALPPSGYRWKTCLFSRMAGQDVSLRLPLYRGIVRATLEVDFASM